MDARLHLARTLALTGNAAEANRLFLAMFKDATGTRDVEGVGYRFYAAERLLDAGAFTAQVKESLRSEANSPNPDMTSNTCGEKSRVTDPSATFISLLLNHIPFRTRAIS